MHCAAYHFIKALDVPSLMITKSKLSAVHHEGGDDDGADEPDEADIDISMGVDASAEDVEAMAATTVTNFDPGDTLGKLLAFVNQVQMLSEGVCKYLSHSCNVHKIKPLELHLWVRTQWGSLAHCLQVTLEVQKVYLAFLCAYYSLILLPQGYRLFLHDCR